MHDYYPSQNCFVSWAVGLLCLLAGLSCGSVAAQSKEASRSSPLHDFLGIDPVSGKFVDQPPPAASSSEHPDVATDDASDTVARSRAAFQELSEKIDSGSLESLSELVGGGVDGGQLARLRRWMIWLTAAILLFYPLSIVLAETYQWSKMRSNVDLVDSDRQHFNSRLIRRLLQAGLLLLLIMGVTIVSLNHYWWSQPVLLSVALIAGGLLCIAVATLHRLIAQADKDHALTLIRQVQREQLEMRADVEELRKRWKQVAQNG